MARERKGLAMRLLVLRSTKHVRKHYSGLFRGTAGSWKLYIRWGVVSELRDSSTAVGGVGVGSTFLFPWPLFLWS